MFQCHKYTKPHVPSKAFCARSVSSRFLSGCTRIESWHNEYNRHQANFSIHYCCFQFIKSVHSALRIGAWPVNIFAPNLWRDDQIIHANIKYVSLVAYVLCVIVRSLFNYVWFVCFHLYYLHFCISLYTRVNVICIKLLITYLLNGKS